MHGSCNELTRVRKREGLESARWKGAMPPFLVSREPRKGSNRPEVALLQWGQGTITFIMKFSRTLQFLTLCTQIQTWVSELLLAPSCLLREHRLHMRGKFNLQDRALWHVLCLTDTRWDGLFCRFLNQVSMHKVPLRSLYCLLLFITHRTGTCCCSIELRVVLEP